MRRSTVLVFPDKVIVEQKLMIVCSFRCDQIYANYIYDCGHTLLCCLTLKPSSGYQRQLKKFSLRYLLFFTQEILRYLWLKSNSGKQQQLLHP
jgi:hypothetical protein